MPTFYFVIVGHQDNPIFEMEFTTIVSKEMRVSVDAFHINSVDVDATVWCFPPSRKKTTVI